MRKVFLYSLILIVGLALSQILPSVLGVAFHGVSYAMTLCMMIGLAFIMIHVGYEFEIDMSRKSELAWDYIVAMTAAAFPWVFATIYFIFVLAPPELHSHLDLWRESLLTSRFASPTSAGVLFSMLAAAGLSATWVFKKLRILAIFDDLDTILLMIPLKILIVGMKWQLAFVILFIVALLWLAVRYQHVFKIPISWPWVMAYAVGIGLFCESVHLLSQVIDPKTHIHLEVLLPAFVLGSMMARPRGADPHSDDAVEGHQDGPESPTEQRVSTIVAAIFMLLVGVAMPKIQTGDVAVVAEAAVLKYEGVSDAVMSAKNAFPGWGMIAVHTLVLTVLINIGKMFPLLCYRKDADLRTRLALSIGLFPRGEVGAGVLAVSVSYGIGGPVLTVALLSLALNLLCTGIFIIAVKYLLRPQPTLFPVTESGI